MSCSGRLQMGSAVLTRLLPRGGKLCAEPTDTAADHEGDGDGAGDRAEEAGGQLEPGAELTAMELQPAREGGERADQPGSERVPIDGSKEGGEHDDSAGVSISREPAQIGVGEAVAGDGEEIGNCNSIRI